MDATLEAAALSLLSTVALAVRRVSSRALVAGYLCGQSVFVFVRVFFPNYFESLSSLKAYRHLWPVDMGRASNPFSLKAKYMRKKCNNLRPPLTAEMEGNESHK